MYRLLNNRFSSLRKLPHVNFLDSNKQLNSCPSCIQYQSTITNPNVLEKKLRSRKKSNKKYYDLLVVTDKAAKQKKTSIKKLTWDDLRLLASSNLNLNELHKLKDQPYTYSSNLLVLEHTYSNLTVIDPPPEEPPTIFKPNNDVFISEIPIELQNHIKELKLGESIDFLDSLPLVNSFQAAQIDEESICEEDEPTVTETKIMQPEVKRTMRHEIVAKTLGSYLEVCATVRNPTRGFNALIFHNSRRHSDKSFPILSDVRVYNAILKGFAANADVQHLEEVVNLMKKEKIHLNIQSFIAIFECYGRVNVRDHYLKKIRIHTKELLQNGHTFDQLMNQGVFLNDERAQVLKSMQAYDPKYIPTYWPPKLQYNNHLVDHLNHENQKKCNEIHVDSNPHAPNGQFTESSLNEALQKQVALETKGYVTVKSIEARSQVTDDVQKYRDIWAEHMKDWEQTALKAFNRDLAALTAQRSPLNNEPYFRCIPAREFVTIIVDEAKKIAEGSETYSPTVTFLYKDLGAKVYARYKVLRKQKTGVLEKVMQIHSNYCQQYANTHKKLDVLPADETGNVFNTRQRWQWNEFKLKSTGATLEMDHREWSPTTLVTIGKFLYHIVMHDLKVDVNAMRLNSKHQNFLPAFYTIFRAQGRNLKEEVKPHPTLSKLYRASMPETLTFPAYDLPMLCPPVPWTGVTNGGYLVAPCEVVRLPPQATSQKQRLQNIENVEQLYPSLDALNQLAAVPWRVNLSILDVILEVFNAGGSSKLDVPEPPSALPSPFAAQSMHEMDKAAKYKYFRQKLQYRRKKAEMYSLWCDCLYRLSLANHYRDDVFWLPHNMDFRGRVYPIPPHLNHLGSDLARSMLVFAEPRPLGPNGLDWLKLHLINLTGLKKRDAIADRLKYANELIDEIMDSADNPLTGRMWWSESEEPWQTLACCMEITKAIRSGQPETFESHFPVHQDGSCNGLQHYAALGRDSAGAYSVNLCPSQVPQDVYSAVVQLVEEARAKDAANGVEVAKLLDGFVKRKVIKQTIMTTVYGVTRFGARLQIAKQLKDLDGFPKDMVWQASSYLTGKTFDSLRTMFKSTREIQDWFTDCARLISAVGGQHVEWVTPMGLPIVQPYIRYKMFANGGTATYKMYNMDQFEKPNVMKQKNAFPPNFIHSLDSSHMMLTSLNCERNGVTFVSVHDCYWTHASTVHIMNKICREQFVALHSEPILENLSMFLAEKYSYDNAEFAQDGSVVDLTKKKLNRILRKLPKTGDFDINQVLRSVYFFS